MQTTFRVQSVADILGLGGVVACPTEAVWGLSCNPLDAEAVLRLLELKQRPVENGLIIVAAAIGQLEGLLAGITPAQRKKLEASWPGPNTWLVPHQGRIPQWVSGQHDTVAVRVSSHPVVQALCQAWGAPLISTSANPAGKQAPRRRFQVVRYFGGTLDAIAPGETGPGTRPSVIRDLATDRVIRA